jgi:hypothetical protein
MSLNPERETTRSHNKSKRPALIASIMAVLIVLATAINGHAQKNEFGIFFGGSYYMGDLNPSRPFVLSRVAMGGLYRYNLNPHIALRANLFYAEIEGNDAITQYQPDRDLNFESSLAEFSTQIEINYLPYQPGNPATPLTPFLYFGAGAFLFHPYEIQPDGRRVDLQFQQEEGVDYATASWQLMFGIGLKFNITRRLTSGIEWGMRRTGTDYLDDIHLRGNPKTNDWYSFAGFVLAFKFADESPAVCPYID